MNRIGKVLSLCRHVAMNDFKWLRLTNGTDDTPALSVVKL
jgi:hypothetical protein